MMYGTVTDISRYMQAKANVMAKYVQIILQGNFALDWVIF